MTKLYGSLEAGGTKFVCAVGDENFNVVEKTQFPTTTPIETIDKTIEFFSKFDNLAGLAVGFWKDLDELHDKARVERTFTPDNDEEKRERRYKGWKKAVKRSLEWAKEDAE